MNGPLWLSHAIPSFWADDVISSQICNPTMLGNQYKNELLVMGKIMFD